MAEKTIAEIAAEAVEGTLEKGQSVATDGMSKTRANLRDAYAVMTAEADRAAARTGRRPLLRGINLSVVE
jgi:hypothetical protein